MAGTKRGGKKAAKTNKQRYGKDFYYLLGKKGGQTPREEPRGFAAMPTEKVRAAGRKGGTRSLRGPANV